MSRWGFQLGIALLLGVAGQLLLKIGAGKLPSMDMGIFKFVLSVLTTPAILLGLVFYAISTFFWLSILRNQELSLVYPLLSLSYILVMAASAIFFKESISWSRGLGTCLVLLGVFFIAR